MITPRPALPLVLAALLAIPHAALAAWPATPSQAVSILSTNHAYESVTVSDGAGGVISVWSDLRAGTLAVLYAQRVTADGDVVWASGGVTVTSSPGANQLQVAACSDGAGGAFVTWQDFRNPDSDIYAQRLGPNGNRLWAAAGVPVFEGLGAVGSPQVTPDGAGGAVFAWADARSGATSDIYAQRLNSAGVAQWTVGGAVVCNAVNSQSTPRLVADGTGGAVIVWSDLRSGTNTDLYAQRMSGTAVALWGANGYPLCTAAGTQANPQLIPDDTGGAIFCWSDLRTAGNEDVYVARLLGNGSNPWSTNGVLVGGATDQQSTPAIVSDDASGAIVAWRDFRSGEYDLYAQRVGPSGGTLWAANGVALCTATGAQTALSLATDGAGGAIAVWSDNRAGIGYDLYARRINALGAALWVSSGTLLLTETNNQDSPIALSDGAGGVVVTWRDARGSGSWDQIRAQHLDRYGYHGDPAPHVTSVRDVPNDQGGRVKVSWTASPLDADPLFTIFDYRVWRSAPTTAAAAAAMLARGTTRDPNDAAANDRWLVLPLAGQDVAWELVATQSAALLGAYSVVVETTGDSAAAGNPRTHYMVEARTSTSLSASRWYSTPDSGYSVDNLAPATPAPFTAQFLGAQTALDWNVNLEADLAGYRLYRGSSASFVPSEANRIASPVDTDFLDPAGAPYVYKLTAVDVHGNESPAATAIPAGTTGVDDPPLAFALAAPTPNPVARTTALHFALPVAGEASLVVYDTNGRVVRTLARGPHAAGGHTAAWDLRDDAGARVAPGVYFARVAAENQRATRKILVAR